MTQVPHASLVNPVSQATSRCFFPRDSRIKIQTAIRFIRHRVVQSFVKARRTLLHWVLRFIFGAQEVRLAAPILGDLRIVLVKFDPNKVTPELECDFAATGRATKRIENNSTTDRRKVRFPSDSHGLSWNVLPPGILPP